METIASPSKEYPSGSDPTITLDEAVRQFIELEDEFARHRWVEACIQRFPVDELLPHLKDVSGRQYLNSDPQIALHLVEALIYAATLTERADYRALGLIGLGDVFGALGRYEESIAAVDEAAEIYRALSDEVGWARTRKEWLRSSHRLGRGEAALAEADHARAILEKHAIWYRAATIEYCIAYVCAEMGRHNEALPRYDHAQAMFELVGADAESAIVPLKSNKALLLTQLGDFRAALHLYEEIRPIHLRHDQAVDILDHNIALVHAAQGHYTRALHTYTAVLAAYQRTGLNYEIACAGVNMVECYLNLNRDSEALDLANETIAHADRHGIWAEAAQARFYGALAYSRLGEIERGLDLLREAEQAFAAAGLSAQSALVVLQRATFHLDDQQWALARQEAERAGAAFAERRMIVRRAQADLVRARASYELGDHDSAARLSHSVLATSRDRDVPWLAHEGHHILGNVARARGDLDAALGAYDDAVASIERMQSSLATELRTHFLADKVRVYEDAIALSLRLSQPQRAFAYLERAKSRALVDYLAGNLEVRVKAREDTNPALLAALDRLREEHNWFYNQLYRYGLGGQDDAGPALSDDALREAIREREKQIARLLERLTLERAADLAVASTPIADIRPSLPALEPGTVLLEYYLSDDAGAVFVVSTAGLTFVPLAARPSEIARLLNQWHLNLASTARAIGSNAGLDGLSRNARAILAALYRALIAPVAPHLAGHERLIVVPYGPTHTVPFHALHDGARYLIETMEVSVCPSSDLLRICGERPRRAERSALVVAYSDGGRLPAVRDEARTIAALLPGECFLEGEATRDRLAVSASRHGVVHLAAHGEARLDNPTFAHLKLADGQLNTADIFNLRLHGALVTLSACETGRSVVAGGDELIGLSRAFLYAGASTLVQSLWRVEDGSTARLMESFYRGIGAGLPKGAALREAQCALLTANGGHPYFWAPFQLIGDRGLV